MLLFHPDGLDHELVGLPGLEAVVGDESEVVPHNDVPLFQLIQHLDLLDFGSLVFVNIAVVAEWKYMYILSMLSSSMLSLSNPAFMNLVAWSSRLG